MRGGTSVIVVCSERGLGWFDEPDIVLVLSKYSVEDVIDSVVCILFITILVLRLLELVVVRVRGSKCWWWGSYDLSHDL